MTIKVSGTFSFTIRAVNSEPVWVKDPPPIEFTSGVAARFNISRFVSDGDGDALVIKIHAMSQAFPGVSFDPASGDLVFDGRDIGTTNLVGTIQFSADDGRPSAASGG